MYFALCELGAKYTQYGKVCTCEGHYVLTVEGPQNGIRFWPHMENLIVILQLYFFCDVMRESYCNKQH